MSGAGTQSGLTYLLDLLSNGDTVVDTYYVAVIVNDQPGFTAGGDELDEPQVPEYLRASISNDSANWDITDNVLSSTVDVIFPLAITDWDPVNFWAICDETQQNGGRALFVGELDVPITVLAGQQLVLPAGSIGIDMAGSQWGMGEL